MKHASEVAEYGSLTTRSQSRGNLSVGEEVDISHGMWTSRERSTEEAIAAQRIGGRHLVELALEAEIPNDRAWEVLQALADERVVDFMSFNVRNTQGYGITDPNYNGMKYTLAPQFVDYLDGKGRTDVALEASQNARDERSARWCSELREQYGDTLAMALDRLWRENPGVAVCVYRHCFLKEPLDQVAPLVGLKTKGAVSRRVSRGLGLMRGWVRDAILSQPEAA